jgi:hypothetical protein
MVLGPSEVGAGTVAAAVTTLLEDPGFVTAARAVAADIAAMPDAGATLAALEHAPRVGTP